MERSSCSGYRRKNVGREIVDILGRKKSVESNNKNRHVRDLYRGIGEFKNVYQPGTLSSTRRVISLQNPTMFLIR